MRGNTVNERIQPSLKAQTVVASVALALVLAAFVGGLLMFVKP